jgi:hypothetical protein
MEYRELFRLAATDRPAESEKQDKEKRAGTETGHKTGRM